MFEMRTNKLNLFAYLNVIRNSLAAVLTLNRQAMNKLILLLFLSYGQLVSAQTTIDTTAIKKQLELIRDRDQKTRTGRDSADFADYIDSTNLVQIELLIAKYGWLGKSFVGSWGNQTCFLVIQHADSATQVKYLPMMQKSVEQGESSAADFALLQDRVLMRQGKKQIYGSQVVFDKQGNNIFYPIEDEINVNLRRAKVGLQPIEEYAKFFGIDYKFPSGK